MRRKIGYLLGSILIALALSTVLPFFFPNSRLVAQVSNPVIVIVSTAPSGSCASILPIRLQFPSGTLYTCQSGTWGPVAGGGPAFPVPISAPDAVLRLPRTDVRSFGAVGNGTTDNCTALTNAASYALSVGSVLYFPPSTGYFGTSCTIPFLGNWIVDGSGPMTLAGGTAASAALISTGTTQTPTDIGIYGPGIINGNYLSPAIVWVMQGNHINISVAGIIGIGAGQKGVYLGDDAGVGAGGNEGVISYVRFGVRINPAHAGSTCIYISGGNGTQGAFTDNDVNHNVLHDCAGGWQDHVGGNNRFSQNHSWDGTNMIACGEEFANGGILTDEYCDTPATYGLRIHGLNTMINGGVMYMGTGGVDNTATAIFFDTSSEPQATVSNVRIYGQDSTHRWAADTNLGTGAIFTSWNNIQNQNNVVSRPLGTNNYVVGATLTVQSNVWLKNSGMFTAGPNVFPCTSVCTFSAGSNWQKATLTQNATSTFTITTPGPAATTYTNFAFLICQPATGGPWTFAWPSNSAGGGTIGTAAGLCSVQNFVWDGTTLRASSAMMTNE